MNKWALKFAAVVNKTSHIAWDSEGKGMLMDCFVLYDSYFDAVVEAFKESLQYYTDRKKLYHCWTRR